MGAMYKKGVEFSIVSVKRRGGWEKERKGSKAKVQAGDRKNRGGTQGGTKDAEGRGRGTTLQV